MPAKRFYIMLDLFRCGETRWEREGRLHGSTDLPLSDAGEAAVAADAARLHRRRIATIYHPADEAATATARVLAEATGARRKAVEPLHDPDLGLLEGLHVKELADRYPKRHKQWEDDLLALVPPEGEPIADARARLFRAIAKMLRRSRAEEIAIVLHPIGFALVRGWLGGRPAEDLRRLRRDDRRVERYALSMAFIDRLALERGRE